MRKTNGFSLIELMVAMAVLTIIATVAVPKVQVWNARNRGLKAVMELLSDFSKARSVAGYTIVNSSGAAFKIPVNVEEEETSDDDDTSGSGKMEVFVGVRSQTAIVFRKKEYGIYQKTSMAAADWTASKSVMLKRNLLADNVTIERVNETMYPASNTTSFESLLAFTSNGMLKEGTDDKIITSIGGNDADKCGNKKALQNVVLSAVIRSKISSGGKESIWYRLNIDRNGDYTICTQFTESESFNFKEKGDPLDGYL